MLCIDCESEISCFYDDSRGGRLVEESEARCVIVHYLQIESQDCFGAVGVSGGVSV